MIGSYLQDKIVVRSAVSDRWENRSFINIVHKARVEQKNQWVRNATGEQVVAYAKVTMKVVKLKYSDLIQIDGVDHAILQISTLKDFSAKYTEVFVA